MASQAYARAGARAQEHGIYALARYGGETARRYAE
jgi:hypothetical protein